MYSIPDMILFDFGQTLVTEEKFEVMKANQALLDIASKKPEGITAEQVQEMAVALMKDISEALQEENRSAQKLEISEYAFSQYLYEYLGIQFPLDISEVEWLFWNTAAPGAPTKNIQKLLDYLHEKGIRTAVISNMMFSTKSLTRKINKLLPNNHFEFILASSDYVFRKPHPRILELALKKANLSPERTWFCGDNLLCDIEGSYQVGMNPVWYPTYIDGDYGVTTEVPYMTVTDWEEVMEMIEKQTKEENLLLELNRKDYASDANRIKRIAVRGLIKKDGKYALIHSLKYGDYKFPGGGMKRGEQLEDTLIREVMEETGLTVLTDSIRYIGRVEEVRKGEFEDILEMTSHYYACEVAGQIGTRNLDEYEEEYGYELEFVSLEDAIKNNESITDTTHIPWIDRDTAVMRKLVAME